MVMIAAALVFMLVYVGVAMRANAGLRNHARLPMQWSFTGAVTWYAPRAIGLALMPVLGTVCLAAYVVMGVFLKPKPGDEGAVWPVFLALGTGFLVIQLLHLALVARTLRGGNC